jgi:ribonuclease III
LVRDALILDWAESALGYRFVDPELCARALTHRSAGGIHNERLEFLGDAVLNCAVADMLCRAFPEADEGELSRRRANLVSGESLAAIASAAGLGEQLRLGSGEQKTGGYRRASILADSLEAVIGAIFLEAGFDTAAAAAARLLAPRLADSAAAGHLKDPKTRLQEWLQARGMPVPVYTLLAAEGEPHLQVFTVRCEVEPLHRTATGTAGSRRRAEQQAAERLLETLQRPAAAGP